MKKLKYKQVVITTLLLPVIILISCSSNSNNTGSEAMSPAEQASEIIGLPVPLPEYLPDGYEVRSIDVEGDAEHWFWDIFVLMSDFEDPGYSNNITMTIHWFYPGLKVVNIEKVAIGETKAIVFREPDYVKLLWVDNESRTIELRGNANLEFDELVKIAESITTPPRDILDVSIEPDYDLVIPRGSSKTYTMHVHNNAIKPVKVSMERDDDLPEDIRVKLQYDSFALKPGESRDINVAVKVEDNAPSPIRSEPEDTGDLTGELQGPPHATIDDPYYDLTITCNYEISGNKPRPKRVYVHFRIDPQNLPPGMITFREAVAVAGFPLSPLLPAYLPKGTEPPPTGYEIGDTKPYCITAVYSSLRVGLCPEPGITGPPKGFTGERTTINDISVVIGENRIDWWSNDIHTSLISEEISIEELKKVAESMLQVAPFSGSWLDNR